MLTLKIPAQEFLDERTQEFHSSKEYVIRLEHSLVSISKWEAKWEKPFLSRKEKTLEETIDYIRCMTITQNVPEEAYKQLTQSNINEVNKYIEAKMTATTVYRNGKTANGKKDTVTSELIYYWMIAYGIPSEYEKWHLNRLLTLIEICDVKAGSSGKKQKPNADMLRQQRELNAARRAKNHSRG